MSTFISALRRTGDNSFQYAIPEESQKAGVKRINIITPSDLNGKYGYDLTLKVGQWLWNCRENLSHNVLKDGIDIKVPEDEPGIGSTWKVKLSSESSLWHTIKSCIPFINTIESREEVTLQVDKQVDKIQNSYLSCFNLWGRKPLNIDVQHDNTLPTAAVNTSGTTSERIAQAPFNDCFTTLSTHCLQRLEPNWTLSVEHQGAYRLLVKDSTLSIEDLKENFSEEDFKQGNSATVSLYKQFLISEYGPRAVEYLQFTYKIDLDTMIKEGLPLLPDHVFKCNIGVLNIEMQDSEILFTKLKKLNQDLSQIKNNSQTALLDYFQKETEPFSMREIRGLVHAITKEGNLSKSPTLEDAQKFLQKLFENDPKNASYMNSKAFNYLIGMIAPSSEDLKRAYTGREIIDRAIMGFHTEGNIDVPDVCRDLFELLHIFDDMRKTDNWDNYYELLAHVVAKKSLFRNRPGEIEDYAGLLLPGPKSKDGTELWYRVDAFVDDNQGNVNYVLVPACEDYKDLKNRTFPLIKLYRSTASNKNAIDWEDSIRADLNPFASPGTLDEQAAYRYEKKHFHDRTIPVWVAYLDHARKLKECSKELNQEGQKELLDSIQSDYEGSYRLALKYFLKCISAGKSDECIQKQEAGRKLFDTTENGSTEDLINAIDSFLYEQADLAQELPKYKTPQDMSFVGHSLGGSLSQHGTNFFVPKHGRVACSGHTLTCYSFDGPGIGFSKDSDFMQFGRKHQKLLKFLDQRWVVRHKFEFGDFVPEAGGNKLGTTGYSSNQDHPWLDNTIEVYKPLKTATIKEITTETAHGRRFQLGKEGIDYQITKLSPKQLAEFDNAYLLSGDVKIAFGYTFLNSPKITETLRRVAGMFAYPLLNAYKFFYTREKPQEGIRDKKGVLYTAYSN